jgi:hypothetical protein
MQGYQLQICRMTRARLRASIGILAIVTCTVGLVVCAPALAASRSAAQLRHSFAQTFVALRVTGNPAAACSLTTSEGQIALIQILRGEGRYLSSTTCVEAFAGRAQAEIEGALLCNLPTPSASEFGPVVRKAIVHVRGNRGTVRLVDDFICAGRNQLTGSVAVANDPLGTSHWIRKRGRWLFDDRPTGTYSPAGRKAVAMLRTALNGSTITEPLDVVTVFCANGDTNLTLGGHFIGSDGPWYVSGGYPFTITGVYPFVTEHPGPPFDAQGNPQGAVYLFGPIFGEWSIKLIGGALAILSTGSGSPATVTPGTAEC